MRDDLKDFSMQQHVARVIFALGTTAAVATGSYFGIMWVFGIR